MRKWAMLLCLLLLAACAVPAAAQTISVYSPFSQYDDAHEAYMRMAAQWQDETGHRIDDYTGDMDDTWLALLREAVESGTADVVIMAPGSGFTGEDMITVDELMQAIPEAGVKRFASMREADGSVLLTPLRLNWEALYVNTDVLAAHGLAVPQSYAELLTACAALSQQGVTPLANAMCEWSEIVLDCAALIGAPEAQYGLQPSLQGAQRLLLELAAVGAFGPDPWNASDLDAQDSFTRGEAAMRFDSDWLAMLIPPEREDSVQVVSLAGADGLARSTVVGVPSIGLALTRACYDDPARREAALSFASMLLKEEHAAQIAACSGGALGESIAQLTADAQDCTGFLYDLIPDQFLSWSDSVVAALMQQ
ncbi:MAG: extracellular solute-binding protein [Clostridia bacterium]|nr:extracellular solute-binding protein [Clostridia bacterium]